MTDRWGYAERILLTGVLFCMLAWLGIVTIQVASLAGWSDEMAGQVVPAINAIAVFASYLLYAAYMDPYTQIFSGRINTLLDTGVAGLYLIGAVWFWLTSGWLDSLACVFVAFILLWDPIAVRVKRWVPERYLTQIEEAVGE